MLKWTKQTGKTMSSGVKRSAPPAPGEGGGGGGSGPGPLKKGPAAAAADNPEGAEGGGRNSNGNAGPPVPLSYSGGEPPGDADMGERAERVVLEVVLPSSSSSSLSSSFSPSPVTVDFNTPMRDLLIHLAATFKVAPTAHVLQLLDPETGKGLDFKPSQTIGALGVSTVYVVPKNKKAEWGKAMKANRAAKGFEITNRFTINLPGGKKAVKRISPQQTLEQVFGEVCREKSLDSRRYTLQHPDNPLTPLDMKATIAQSRLTEINVIHAGVSSAVGDASRSMPDLHRGGAGSPPAAASQDPASWYMPGAGEVKKKRGFLSFLSKKDKKFKPHEAHYTTAAATSGQQQQLPPPAPSAATTLPRKASTPPTQRRSSDVGGTAPPPRPKTMFLSGEVGNITATTMATGGPSPGKASVPPTSSSTKGPAPPPGKKRPAPPPPPQKKKAPAAARPEGSQQAVKVPVLSSTASGSNAAAETAVTATAVVDNVNVETVRTFAPAVKASPGEAAPPPAATSQPGRHHHSRNSSDSSGYHELTLSGTESPEASRVPPTPTTALKTSIDATSIESADHPNGDSGILQDLSPGSEGCGSMPIGPPGKGKVPSAGPLHQQQQQGSLTAGPGKPKPLPSTKKKKAPPPPPKAKPAPVREETTDGGVGSAVASSQQQPPPPVPVPVPVPGPGPGPTPSSSTFTSGPENSERLALPQQDVAISAAVHADAEGKTKSTPTKGEGDHEAESDSDSDSGEAFNIEDILDAVEFEEPPLPFNATTTTTTTATTTTTKTEYSLEEENEEPGRMVMMETASVLSEDVQVPEEDFRSRPCEFVPPPPPEEPPPPTEDYPLPTEYPPAWSSGGGPEGAQYADKGTLVGEDNASLAPASLKGSPVSKQGYTNEMARFVAQMSRLTTDEPSADGGGLSSNDTSVSLPDTESVSDTGSVICHGDPHHARGDSKDSKDSQSSLSSLDRPADSSSVLDGHGGGGGEVSVSGGGGGAGITTGTFAVMQEIDAPLEMVPPPLEFRGGGDKGVEEEEDEEEVTTVVTEEYVIPVGPSGPDYSAAVKVSEETQQQGSSSSRSVRDSTEGLFRAKPVSILQPPEQSVTRQREEEEKKPAAKEEFVLTLDDLSSVSLVPPRTKAAPASSSHPPVTPALMEPDPLLEPESQPVAEASKSSSPRVLAQVPFAKVSSLVEHRFGKPKAVTSDTKNPPPQQSRIGPRAEASADKPLSTLYLPTMRYSTTVEPMTFSDDDRSSVSSIDPVHHHHPNPSSSSTSSSARLPRGPGTAADDASDDASSDRPGGVDSRRMSDSSSASQTLPPPPPQGDGEVEVDTAREELQQQYSSLQDQFVLWQQQLQQNQALLAAHGSGPADANSDDTLRTLQAQMQMQQQMMTQLQMSIEALSVQQQQQQQEQEQGEEELPAPPVDIPSPAVPEEESPAQSSLSPPSYPPPPPPIEAPEPPPPPPPTAPPPAPKVIRAGTKPKTSAAASRFEPQLDPREELMIAIRSFGGREHLKTVSTKETKWVHSTK